MQYAKGDRPRVGDHLLDHFLMHLRIAHHALLSDLLSACLKLRLDQAHHLSALFHEIPHRQKYLGQRDEGDVDGDKLHGLSDILGRHIADVRALHAHYPLIVSELPVQLPVAHIHRIDLHRAVLKHTVRKSSGRRADIHADPALEAQPEVCHRLLQLQSSAAHIGERVPLNRDLYGLRKHGSRLIFSLAVHQHAAGHNDGFCLFSGRRQVPLYQ